MSRYKNAWHEEQRLHRSTKAALLKAETELAVQKGVTDKLTECLHKLIMHGRIEIKKENSR